jgi:hypothetical protein
MSPVKPIPLQATLRHKLGTSRKVQKDALVNALPRCSIRNEPSASVGALFLGTKLCSALRAFSKDDNMPMPIVALAAIAALVLDGQKRETHATAALKKVPDGKGGETDEARNKRRAESPSVGALYFWLVASAPQ